MRVQGCSGFVHRCRSIPVAALIALCGAEGAAGAPTNTVQVRVRLRAGGEISGLVVDHDEHALVIVRDGAPYVFSWHEMELASALRARRAALEMARGGEERLTAQDWFGLGEMALHHGRGDVAATQFREAEKRDRELAPQIAEVLSRYHCERLAPADEDAFREGAVDPLGGEDDPPAEWTAAVFGSSPDVEARLTEAYHTFGAKVQEVLGKDVAALESEHFLIWTDWEKKHRDRLQVWCESMYAKLSEQFAIPPGQSVFPAKCPVFCFRSKARFQKFARYFDGYDGASATGYTRSIERHGHVHVVLLRQGGSELDFDLFACTLVHEGTHAFVHRLHSPVLIPHWINEGLAELMAERVLGEGCDSGESSALLARQYGRYGWRIGGLLEGVSTIEVSQYPLVHSIVAYLESLGGPRLAAFVRAMKEGRSTAEALAQAYDGMTLEQLEASWRASVRPAEFDGEKEAAAAQERGE